MQIHETRAEGAIAVAPAGRIDSTTAPALEQHLLALVDRGEHRLVIDFARVEYISSAGLRVMLALARRLRDARGRLALCALPDSVRQVFQLAGFTPLFTIVENLDQAIREVGAL